MVHVYHSVSSFHREVFEILTNRRRPHVREDSEMAPSARHDLVTTSALVTFLDDLVGPISQHIFEHPPNTANHRLDVEEAQHSLEQYIKTEAGFDEVLAGSRAPGGDLPNLKRRCRDLARKLLSHISGTPIAFGNDVLPQADTEEGLQTIQPLVKDECFKEEVVHLMDNVISWLSDAWQ